MGDSHIRICCSPAVLDTEYIDYVTTANCKMSAAFGAWLLAAAAVTNPT